MAESISHGLWSQPGVPHRGWECVGISDLEEPSHLCDMCQTAMVRYVHHMEHPDYDEELDVGCICAGNMEEDYERAKERESRFKSQTRRRAEFPFRRNWRQSASGGWFLRTEGFVLNVYRKAEVWRVAVGRRDSGKPTFGRRDYSKLTDAQRAAFDALMWAKGRDAA